MKIMSRLRHLFKKKRKIATYKIGKKKFHNSLVDSLIPQMVEIGENFTSGPNSIILSHDASLFVHTGKYRVEKTVIGDNVFLGANATVLPGVTIGNNVIIGAGSVVTKDFEEGSVIAGNPAKFICTISEYIIKCEKKDCLYEPPESFNNLFDNIPLTASDIEEFQKKVLEKNGRLNYE